MSALEIGLPDVEATVELGAVIAQWLQSRRGAVLYLYGDLGAGKTTLARGLLHALGVRGAVRSPTYTLVEPYELDGRRVLHMDLYRLQDPEELEGLGVRDDPPDHCVWLVEWPERAEGALPAPDLEIRLTHADGARTAALSGMSAASLAALPAWRGLQDHKQHQ